MSPSARDRRTDAALGELARMSGIQTSYQDVFGTRRRAARESLVHGLRALGAPVERAEDAPDALRARAEAVWGRLVEPVTVAWTGRIDVRLREGERDGRLRFRLVLEEGGTRSWTVETGDRAAAEETELDGRRVAAVPVPLPGDLPAGYHRLEVRAGRRKGSSLVIAAPERAPGADHPRSWGVFHPVYGLRSARDWGVGDLSDLE
ncbi:MAG: 4-alpha-glucanotransferase, partial [Actinomycetota bacterium]|nr:4-alpha-glucanotransferase [Actinomycetota bacterium]